MNEFPSTSWAPGCIAYTLHQNNHASVKLETMETATEEKLHYHCFATQVFYMLEGDAIFELDGRMYNLNSDSIIVIPPGQPHRILNQSEAPIRFLVLSYPPTTCDRIEVNANL